MKIGNEFSQNVFLSFGVPQGSVLGPVIFTMYTQPLANILKHHEMKYHFYADDCQLYKSAVSEKLSESITSTKLCILDIKTWMDSNKLKLNEMKTEIILCGNPRITKDLPNVEFEINGHLIQSSEQVKNLGVIMDSDMSMSSQISSLCKSTRFQLRNISRVRHLLTDDVTKKPDYNTCFITARLL